MKTKLLADFQICVSVPVIFHEYLRFTWQQGKDEAISLILLYHFYPLHKHLDISWAIAVDSSPSNYQSNERNYYQIQNFHKTEISKTWS